MKKKEKESGKYNRGVVGMSFIFYLICEIVDFNTVEGDSPVTLFYLRLLTFPE